VSYRYAAALSLLSTNLRGVVKQSGAVLAAFCVGSVGSVVGTGVAYALVGPSLGPDAWKIAVGAVFR
jgi:uncharacterized membrane protein